MRRRRPNGRGSALLLMPAAVLVLLVLGAIAVDSAVAFLGEREVANAADAAANDAATALDAARFHATGDVAIDCERAAAVAAESFRRRLATWVDEPRLVVTSCGGDAVRISTTAAVRFVFAPALPGAPHRLEVSAQAQARARHG